MKFSQKHLQTLKDFLDKKIEPEDIAEVDKSIIIELCKARKKQLQDKLEIQKKKLQKLKSINNQ